MLEISSLVCHVDDERHFKITMLERDSKRCLNDVLETFDLLLTWPPIRKEFGHSGDKANMVVVNRSISSTENHEFGLEIYFEEESIRYEPFGSGVLPSFGRADADVMREALRILASGNSPLTYLEDHGNLTLYDN